MDDTFAVFLRAVNLGARNKVPMKGLAHHLGDELDAPVANYLQSGNLVVRCADRAGLAALVSRLIARHYDLTIPAVVRSAGELDELVAANPWPAVDPVKVHLGMWDGTHDPAAAATMAAADWAGDAIVFVGGNAWVSFEHGSQRSKLNAQVVDRRLGVTSTFRNSRTILAVAALAAEAGRA